MGVKVAINGFGRIGRAVFRIIAGRPEADIDVVAINDLADDEVLAYLLEYDSVMGPFEHEVKLEDGVMTVDKHRIQMLRETTPPTSRGRSSESTSSSSRPASSGTGLLSRSTSRLAPSGSSSRCRRRTRSTRRWCWV